MAEVFWAIVRDEQGDRKKVYTKARISEASLSRALDGYVPGQQVIEKTCVAYPRHAAALLSLWRVESMRQAAEEVEDLAAVVGAHLGPRPAGPPVELPEPLKTACDRVSEAMRASSDPAAWLEGALGAFEAVAKAHRPLQARAGG